MSQPEPYSTASQPEEDPSASSDSDGGDSSVRRHRMQEARFELDLPAPPPVHITFCGRHAVTTGVVNLRLLLGETGFYLVESTSDPFLWAPEDGETASQPSSSAAVKQRASSDGAVAHTRGGEEEAGLRTAAYFVLAGSEDLPLGCFHVREGGQYWIARANELSEAEAADAHAQVTEAPGLAATLRSRTNTVVAGESHGSHTSRRSRLRQRSGGEEGSEAAEPRRATSHRSARRHRQPTEALPPAEGVTDSAVVVSHERPPPSPPTSSSSFSPSAVDGTDGAAAKRKRRRTERSKTAEKQTVEVGHEGVENGHTGGSPVLQRSTRHRLATEGATRDHESRDGAEPTSTPQATASAAPSAEGQTAPPRRSRQPRRPRGVDVSAITLEEQERRATQPTTDATPLAQTTNHNADHRLTPTASGDGTPTVDEEEEPLVNLFPTQSTGTSRGVTSAARSRSPRREEEAHEHSHPVPTDTAPQPPVAQTEPVVRVKETEGDGTANANEEEETAKEKRRRREEKTERRRQREEEHNARKEAHDRRKEEREAKRRQRREEQQQRLMMTGSDTQPPSSYALVAESVVDTPHATAASTDDTVSPSIIPVEEQRRHSQAEGERVFRLDAVLQSTNTTTITTATVTSSSSKSNGLASAGPVESSSTPPPPLSSPSPSATQKKAKSSSRKAAATQQQQQQPLPALATFVPVELETPAPSQRPDVQAGTNTFPGNHDSSPPREPPTQPREVKPNELSESQSYVLGGTVVGAGEASMVTVLVEKSKKSKSDRKDREKALIKPSLQQPLPPSGALPVPVQRSEKAMVETKSKKPRSGSPVAHAAEEPRSTEEGVSSNEPTAPANADELAAHRKVAKKAKEGAASAASASSPQRSPQQQPSPAPVQPIVVATTTPLPPAPSEPPTASVSRRRRRPPSVESSSSSSHSGSPHRHGRHRANGGDERNEGDNKKKKERTTPKEGTYAPPPPLNSAAAKVKPTDAAAPLPSEAHSDVNQPHSTPLAVASSSPPASTVSPKLRGRSPPLTTSPLLPPPSSSSISRGSRDAAVGLPRSVAVSPVQLPAARVAQQRAEAVSRRRARGAIRGVGTDSDHETTVTTPQHQHQRGGPPPSPFSRAGATLPDTENEPPTVRFSHSSVTVEGAATPLSPSSVARPSLGSPRTAPLGDDRDGRGLVVGNSATRSPTTTATKASPHSAASSRPSGSALLRGSGGAYDASIRSSLLRSPTLGSGRGFAATVTTTPPQESPALGFTQVYNSLAEEFSLDPSSASSDVGSEEYLYGDE